MEYNAFRQLKQEREDSKFVGELRLFFEDKAGEPVYTLRTVFYNDDEPAYITRRTYDIANLENVKSYLDLVKKALHKPIFDKKNFPKLHNGELPNHYKEMLGMDC